VTGGLDQPGVVGGVRPVPVGVPQDLGAEPLRGLDGDELGPVDHTPVAAPDRVDRDDAGDDGRRSGPHRGHDRTEQRGRGQGAGGVMDEHHGGTVGNRVDTGPHRGRPGVTADDHPVGVLVERCSRAHDEDDPVATLAGGSQRPVEDSATSELLVLLRSAVPAAGTGGRHDDPHRALGDGIRIGLHGRSR
jgi:hypothetical protein